jgi:GTP-binding protein
LLPVVSIVGRPNVGKSSLFNRLARRRAAIVHDRPGVTRDRKTAEADLGGVRAVLVDTGGLMSAGDGGFSDGISAQVAAAIEESAVIVMVCDGRDGVAPHDFEIAGMLRTTGKPVILAVNKMDSESLAGEVAPSFYELGLGEPVAVSAEHGLGVRRLAGIMADMLPDAAGEAEGDKEAFHDRIRVAVVGRPNVGKSTLVNRLLGSERMLVSEVPGTTRDAVDTAFSHEGRGYTLIDTAGIRRRRSIGDDVEKICVVMAMDAVGRCDVALLVIDSSVEATEQDARIAGMAVEKGRALAILANKWDAAAKSGRWKGEKDYESDTRYRLKFLGYSPVICVSGRTGHGLDRILPAVDRAYSEYVKRIPTADLNRVLETLQAESPPPLSGGKRVRFYYAAQTSTRPPKFTIVTNNPAGVHFSYRRRVANTIREAFGFRAVPIRIDFKARKRKPD